LGLEPELGERGLGLATTSLVFTGGEKEG